MSTLFTFLQDLFRDGRISFQDRPVPLESECDQAIEVLRLAFAENLMDLAGPPLPFDPDIARTAADWTRQACWFLVSRDEPVKVLERALALPRPARSASGHLAADLTFRYLPLVYQRAKAMAPGDLLTSRLVELLRDWPLSGVLSAIEEPPTTPPRWNGHPGLTLLYAERLAATEKLAWLPDDPIALECLELVLHELGKPRSVLLDHLQSPVESVNEGVPRG